MRIDESEHFVVERQRCISAAVFFGESTSNTTCGQTPSSNHCMYEPRYPGGRPNAMSPSGATWAFGFPSCSTRAGRQRRSHRAGRGTSPATPARRRRSCPIGACCRTLAPSLSGYSTSDRFAFATEGIVSASVAMQPNVPRGASAMPLHSCDCVAAPGSRRPPSGCSTRGRRCLLRRRCGGTRSPVPG